VREYFGPLHVYRGRETWPEGKLLETGGEDWWQPCGKTSMSGRIYHHERSHQPRNLEKHVLS
jgi:hypothetical protein